MARSTSKLRAPMSRASTAPRRRRPAATTAVSAAVVWRWSAWSLPLLLVFLCAGSSAAALRVMDPSSSAAAATTTTTTAATATTSAEDPDTFTYGSSWDSSPFNLQSVTENNLGLMAKACSQTYCHAGTSGLDLWVSLEEVSSGINQIDTLLVNAVLCTYLVETWYAACYFDCCMICMISYEQSLDKCKN